MFSPKQQDHMKLEKIELKLHRGNIEQNKSLNDVYRV